MSRKHPLPYTRSCPPKSPYMESVVSVQYPTYRSLCVDEIKCPNGKTAYRFVDDVQLLLSQDKLSSDYCYSLFASEMQNKVSSLRPVKKPKMTDKQLHSYIKSRHIQSPSELKGWLDYLSSRYDIVKSDLEDQASSLVDTPDSVEPPTPSPQPAE